MLWQIVINAAERGQSIFIEHFGADHPIIERRRQAFESLLEMVRNHFSGGGDPA